MRYRSHLRLKFPGQYATELPDGTVIPWRTLTLQEFIDYDLAARSQILIECLLEDEIFIKCVLDPVIVKDMNKLPAGTIPMVVSAINSLSGPASIEELDCLLNLGRSSINNILHDLVEVTIQAFPAYTPDDLYDMDYITLMKRVALAEKKLLRTGMLKEPLSLISANQQETEVPQKAPVNLKQQFQEQQAPASRMNRQIPIIKNPEEVSFPKVPTTKATTIIKSADVDEHTAHYQGHEKGDRILLEDKMVKETAGFYKNYLKQIQETGKLQILTPDERKDEIDARMEENKRIAKELIERKKKQDKQEDEEVRKALAQKTARERRTKKLAKK